MDLAQTDEPKIILKSQTVKEQIKISKAQLHEYAANEIKFERKIKELNALGAHYINEDIETEALNYLLQAEKILQYVASCGRTIDRVLITATLQNQACAYRKLDELERASDYMEAILSNTQSTLDSISSLDIGQKLKDQLCEESVEFSLVVGRKLESVFYYLQYSALNSQIDHHHLAMESARSAMKVLQNICYACLKYEKIKKGKNSILMEGLLTFFELEELNLKSMISKVKIALNQISKHHHFFSFDSALIQGFMIGEIMQIGTTTIEQKLKKIKIEDHVSQLALTYKAFYLSICYFVMGTQLRFLSTKNENKEGQYQLSQLHHLHAIKIVAELIPCESRYLTHLIHSYRNHYKINLLEKEPVNGQYISIQNRQRNSDFNSSKKSPKMDEKINGRTLQVYNEAKIVKTPHTIKKSPMLKSKKHLKTIKTIKQSQNPEENAVYAFPKKKGDKNTRQKNKQMKLYSQNGERGSHSSRKNGEGVSLKKTQIEKSNREYMFNEFKLTKKKKTKLENRSKSKEKMIELSTDMRKKKT